jgi:hypothetical protein
VTVKKVAVFQSTEFSYDRTKSGSPAGRECAERITELLKARDIPFKNSKPIEGDFGWFLYPELHGVTYEVVIQWAVPRDRDGDFWSLWIEVKQGLLKRLFGKPLTESQVEAIHSPIAQALLHEEARGRISNLTWLTEPEFYTHFTQ